MLFELATTFLTLLTALACRTKHSRPINDPLHVNKGDMNDNLKFYKQLCQGTDRQSVQLSNMAQRAQEEFYGKWVGEMVRIAKVRT